MRIACPACGAAVERIKDVGNPWLDAGIVPFSTLHFREDPDYWREWFPADFITESFPGQFRNWFYSMLAMSTVLRREPPFKTIFGYALVFAEDGRPMHKSWGNAIEFDEAADRMGVDVMRWMFAKARPEENIPFGWHAADEARRELLILWNVYAFFITYARLAGWSPSDAAPAPADRPVLDRWILSRAAGTATVAEARLADFDAVGATRALSSYLDGLSTWYLRLSRRRFSRSDDRTDQAGAFATLHAALVATARMLAPILPFLAESLYGNLVTTVDPDAPDSVHLTRWPSAELATHRDEPLEASMAVVQSVVDLARTLRSTAHLKTRQPLATAWIALPDRGLTIGEDLLGLIADEINVKDVVVIEDDSALVERRVKPLLPRIGKRLGSAIPAVMAAARDGEVVFEADGSVTLAGVTLASDEVEIQATPRPGTAVAHHDGLVVVLDTALTPELVAEGEARELARAIQDLRREAALELDDRIDLWVGRSPRWRRRAPALGRRRHPCGPRRGRATRRCRVGRRGARRRPGHDRAPPPHGRPVSEVPIGETGGTGGTADTTATTAGSRAHWLVFAGVAVAVMIVDQLAKAWLVANVSPGEVVNVIGDYLRLILSQNSGALFGLFADNAVMFGIASLAVVGLIVAYHARAGRSLYLSIALGLLLGGALGNLIDRLRLGYVVDFVDIGIGNLRFYTFNLADAAISTAIVMLIAAAIFPALIGWREKRSDG